MKCNSCGTINDKDAIYCGSCGEMVLEGKKVCYECGDAVDLSVDYCPRCNTFLKKGYIKCKKCGKENSDEFKYCTNCRTRNKSLGMNVIQKTLYVFISLSVINIIGFIAAFLPREVQMSGYINDSHTYEFLEVSRTNMEFFDSYIIGMILSFLWLVLVITLVLFSRNNVKNSSMKIMNQRTRKMITISYIMMFLSSVGFLILDALISIGSFRVYVDGGRLTGYDDPTFLELLSYLGNMLVSTIILVMGLIIIIKWLIKKYNVRH